MDVDACPIFIEMRLVGANGHLLDLAVLGYQFPAIEDDHWDSNWLNVRVSAANDRGSWEATDPSLLTSELLSLAAWLEATAAGRSSSSRVDFLEPNLSFELIDRNDRVRLRAWFELELRTAMGAMRGSAQRDLCVDLDVTGDQLRAAAASLHDQLERFPPRARNG